MISVISEYREESFSWISVGTFQTFSSIPFERVSCEEQTSLEKSFDYNNVKLQVTRN